MLFIILFGRLSFPVPLPMYSTHACLNVEIDGQPENLTPPATSVRWTEAKKQIVSKKTHEARAVSLSTITSPSSSLTSVSMSICHISPTLI